MQLHHQPVRHTRIIVGEKLADVLALPAVTLLFFTGKKPQKPPRPSLPKPVVTANTTTFTNAADQSDSKLEKADSAHTCTRSVTVHWDILKNPHPVSAVSTDPTPSPRRPVPRPRSKSRKQAAEEETKEQILVKLSENCEDIQSDPQEVSSNKYLQELLEVFSADNELEDNSDINNPLSDQALQGEDDAGEMNDSHSQRNIRARIQAFESQGSEEGNAFEPAKSEPPTRKPSFKPPVAAKPSVALKPQLSQSTDDYYQSVPDDDAPQKPPPAPRPQSFKKPVGLSIKEELETLHRKASVQQKSRPSVLTRANSVYEEDTSPIPPLPPAKPRKEPLQPNLNINNHNSAFMDREYEYVDVPSRE